MSMNKRESYKREKQEKKMFNQLYSNHKKNLKNTYFCFKNSYSNFVITEDD